VTRARHPSPDTGQSHERTPVSGDSRDFGEKFAAHRLLAAFAKRASVDLAKPRVQ
jgi:hypothetical protein